jgi:hypothetical protein
MTLRRAVHVAACALSVVAAMPAAAQFQPFQAPPQQQQEPPCLKEFLKLRGDAEQKAGAIKAASDRKAPPAVACKLFRSFVAAESKMLKYASEHAAWCGIPDQIVDGIKKAHVRSTQLRNKICQVAAAPPRPPGPSLSDALGSRPPSSANIKSGHGTFDTLTGTPLGER